MPFNSNASGQAAAPEASTGALHGPARRSPARDPAPAAESGNATAPAGQ